MEGRQPDPAPSPTNTAGLEVVAWAWDHWTHLTDKWTRRATFDEPQDGSRVRNIEPLVTAASAQARIAELEAEVEAHRSGAWILAETKRAQAAEARADRLATLSTRLSARLCEALERAYVTDAEWVKTEYPNGVTETYVIEAALQQEG